MHNTVLKYKKLDGFLIKDNFHPEKKKNPNFKIIQEIDVLDKENYNVLI